jgi:hypothetical protein
MKLNKRDLKMILSGFLLGVIALFIFLKLFESSVEVEPVDISVDEWEDSSLETLPTTDSTTSGIDKADMQWY